MRTAVPTVYLLQHSVIFPDSQSRRQLIQQQQITRANKQVAKLTKGNPIDLVKLFNKAKKEVELGSVVLFFRVLPQLCDVLLTTDPTLIKTINLLWKCLENFRSFAIPDEELTTKVVEFILKLLIKSQSSGLFPRLTLIMDFLDTASYFPKLRIFCLWKMITLLQDIRAIDLDETQKMLTRCRGLSQESDTHPTAYYNYLEAAIKLGSATAVRLLRDERRGRHEPTETLAECNARALMAHSTSIKLRKECFRHLMLLRDPAVLYNQGRFLLGVGTDAGTFQFFPIPGMETDDDQQVIKAFQLLAESAEAHYHLAIGYINQLCGHGFRGLLDPNLSPSSFCAKHLTQQNPIEQEEETQAAPTHLLA